MNPSPCSDEERLRQSHGIDICVKRAIDIDDPIYVFGKNAQHHYFCTNWTLKFVFQHGLISSVCSYTEVENV